MGWRSGERIPIQLGFLICWFKSDLILIKLRLDYIQIKLIFSLTRNSIKLKLNLNLIKKLIKSSSSQIKNWSPYVIGLSYNQLDLI